MYKRRKAIKLFPGLAGSPWAKYASAEKSITEIINSAPKLSASEHRASKKSDVYISSADLDPAFEYPKSQNTNHFQATAFDPRLKSGHKPTPFEPGDGGNGIGDGYDVNESSYQSSVSQVFDVFGEDINFMTIRGLTPRKKTPHWILTSLSEFILGRVEPADRTPKRIPRWAVLDFIILDDYYRRRRTDEQIFTEHLKRFKKDKAGSRWTRSVSAVKMRRFCLVKEGYKLFGPEKIDPEIFVPNPDCRPMLRKLDEGPGGFIQDCYVLGCRNQIESSKPISGKYICENHPESIQKQAAKASKVAVLVTSGAVLRGENSSGVIADTNI